MMTFFKIITECEKLKPSPSFYLARRTPNSFSAGDEAALNVERQTSDTLGEIPLKSGLEAPAKKWKE